MKATPDIYKKLDQLLEVLDADAEQMNRNLRWLEQLRELLVKRDEKALHRLLQHIQAQSSKHQETETRRCQLRNELARAMACSADKVTLSMLAESVCQPRSSRITEKKHTLNELAARLKREYFTTTMLIADCSRFNRHLLDTVFGFNRNKNTTYSIRGQKRQNTESSIVNLKF